MTTGPKIFCIGFHKTASSSLAQALEILLEHRVCGPVGFMRADIADTYRELAYELLDDYPAFKDNPWTILYQDLDRWRPGSKFILTVRPSAKWIKSAVENFRGESTPMRELIYGAGRGEPTGNEELYVARFERHNAEVLEYFKDRPDDLLVMDIGSGDGWDKLCGFLKMPKPAVPFPVVGSAAERAAGIKYSYKVLRYPYGKAAGPEKPK